MKRGKKAAPIATVSFDPVYCQQCKKHTNRPSYCHFNDEFVARKQVVSNAAGEIICEGFERRA